MPKKYKKIAYSFVMADLLHYGHLRLLKTARENADYHICGVVSDEACHLWQGVNICNYNERKSVVESLDCVDEVMEQKSMDPAENLKIVRKRYPGSEIVVVHGNDWQTMPGREYVESIGGRIIQPKYYEKLSRPAIMNKIKYSSVDNHPFQHEYFTHHFRIGNIVHFNPQVTHPLISTKANTLRNFGSLLKLSRIEELFICTVEDFQTRRDDIIKVIKGQFRGRKIVVRSSSLDEDRYGRSGAGCYDSVADIDSDSLREIGRSIKAVIRSYRRKGALRPKDQILIQAQTSDVRVSGVICTRNIQSNTSYYLINYDDETGRTDTVTGGAMSKSVWIYRGLKISEYPAEWRKLLLAVREIESHLAGMILDIEFAQKSDGTVIIYQIRPLAANARVDEAMDAAFERMIEENIEKYRESAYRAYRPKPTLSDMAFWNPSEIIGDNPHPLDYSIYREIVTKKAWNKGLTDLGYSLVKYELMERYGNKPYVNVDHAFYSLIPVSITGSLKKKLLKFYKEKLTKDPAAHDKIEFEIVMSCYDFETQGKATELLNKGFSNKEIKKIAESLKELTFSIIKNYKKSLRRYKKDLKALDRKRKTISSGLRGCSDPRKYIKGFLDLLSDVELRGTKQFAAIARQAFIAKAICRSLVNTGQFSKEEMNNFMGGISTVATDFCLDFQKYFASGMDKERFIGKYGHLRTGTYDITAPRYDSVELTGSHFYEPVVNIKRGERQGARGKGKLRDILKRHKFLGLNENELTYFIESAIKEREKFKFEFTKSLSLALEFLARAGKLLGFSREELSYLDVNVIRSSGFYGSDLELTDFWKSLVAERKTSYASRSRLILPSVIQDENDFKIVRHHGARPNFITEKCINGSIANLETKQYVDIKGKVVLITKADPGFDWIFTKGIKGLITKYGGAASHMAIRCAEFNVPAAIGCGERIYSRISGWKGLKLDCRKRRIEQSWGKDA